MLAPSALDAYTAREVGVLIAGALWREERANDRAALIASLIMRSMASGAPNPDQILGRPFGSTRLPGYPESHAEDA